VLVVWGTLVVGAAGCRKAPDRADPPASPPPAQQAAGATQRAEDPTRVARLDMVNEQIVARGVRDSRVLEAMRRVPRHEFVPAEVIDLAYQDRPLPIGHEQTISQPYVVAAMTELARVAADAVVLEIGTGSGYQTAVLAELAARVYSIEIIDDLGRRAATTLTRLGYRNVEVRIGDGYAGWPEEAPFDAIVVTAAPPQVPRPLLEQLRVGGRMVVPVGTSYQELMVVERGPAGYRTESAFPVRFVPMVGAAQD